MTSPVVYLPLSQDIINANITVEKLQEFQQVDNIVEVQLENPPAPTILPPVFDAAFYHRTNSVVTAVEKLLPLMHKMFADKESSKEDTGNSVNNPVASPSDSAPQVPVVAPQDPGSALGPSSASLEPIASTSPPAATPGCYRLHVVVRARGSSLNEVAMPPLRFKIVSNFILTT